jgi:hypothetical protein
MRQTVALVREELQGILEQTTSADDVTELSEKRGGHSRSQYNGFAVHGHDRS